MVIISDNFRFVHVDSVAQSLGILPFINIVTFKFGFQMQTFPRQHEFFLELVYFLKIEGLFLGFLELLNPICVFKGVERVLGAAAVGRDIANHNSSAVASEGIF